jgi:hypothetical protein
MQYVVNEVHSKASPLSGYAKVFDDLTEAIEYITHISRNQKLLVNDADLHEEKVNEALKERLSSVLISSNESDKHKKWLVTAF